VRRVVEGLRPPALDELGLCGALEQAGNRLTSGSRVVVDLHVGTLPALPAAVEVAAYRIATEALANAVRHADPSRCSVAVTVETGMLVLTIRDDGAGFSSAPPAGNGLHTMRERAEELRGSLTVGPAPSGRGTIVTARIPVATAPSLAPSVPPSAAPAAR
jgi:signal transduction histidine kinase